MKVQSDITEKESRSVPALATTDTDHPEPPHTGPITLADLQHALQQVKPPQPSLCQRVVEWTVFLYNCWLTKQENEVRLCFNSNTVNCIGTTCIMLLLV